LLLVVINFRTPEKKQFEREMGTLLGPAIVPGNKITAMQTVDKTVDSIDAKSYDACCLRRGRESGQAPNGRESRW
jgi:hypothetical protein